MAALDDYRELIESALVHAKTHFYEDVAEMVENNEAQFWPGDKSVIITQTLDYPQAKVLYVWVAAGERTEILRMMNVIEQWGTAQGCTRALFTGRVGWQRALKPESGWSTTAVCMEKRL